MVYAAGIVPYFKISNKKYFLLGYERGSWSGFVGGSEENETIRETALREFHEETKLIFKDYPIHLNFIFNTDITPSGKTVYIWFVEFDNSLLHLIDNFKNSKLKGKQFNEKSDIGLFTLNQIIKMNNVFYKLKELIVNYY